MPVPNSIDELEPNPASNSPLGSEQVFPNLDNYMRFFASCIAQLRDRMNVEGLPMGQVLWWGGARSAIAARMLALDGQTLNRADHPQLWTFVSGGYPQVSEADWLATPAKRASFSSGNGSTTFRMPDLNGWQQNSIGSLTVRGDGPFSAGAAGSIQDSQNLAHGHSASLSSDGAHNHFVNDPGHRHSGGANQLSGGVEYVGAGGNAYFGGVAQGGSSTAGISLGSAGAHSHTPTIQESGGNEARAKVVTGAWVMRVR